MRHYVFSIKNNAIDKLEEGTTGEPSEYTHYEKSLGVEEIYYKISNGEITNIMCEAKDLNSATKAVNEFLLNL